MQRSECFGDGHGQSHFPTSMAIGASIFTIGKETSSGYVNHGFQIGGRNNRIAIRVCSYGTWGDWLYLPTT